MTSDRRSYFHMEFIDPLFAVAIGFGLSEGIFREDWFQAWRFPTGLEVFEFWTFGLGFLTLLLAWLGYHKSIRDRPVKGLGRFGLDVLLVVFYAAMLVKYQDFSAVLGLLLAVYIGYTIWSILKAYEYAEDYQAIEPWMARYRREVVTCGWTLVFLGLWLLWTYGKCPRWTILTGCYVATVGHRVNKEVPLWSHLLQGLKALRR